MGDNYNLTLSADKTDIFQQLASLLFEKTFKLIDFDVTKPWGFYLSVDESQAQKFIDEFYKGSGLDIDTSLPLRPKFLGIAPGKRLSWQYHHRRSEIWRTLAGRYKLVTSDSDEENVGREIKEGEVISIAQGQRHRGIGLDKWAVVAEIWRHIDKNDLSDEDDIVRVQDDFGR
jgi:mannose-6-phosphate isomerase